VFYPLLFVQIAYLRSVVQFSVGVITYKQRCLRICHRLHCVLKVEPSVTASEILKLAVPVLWEMELELPDAEYCLIYSNKKLADKVPLSDEPFTLEAYKAYSSTLKILALSGKRIVLVEYLATAAEAT